MNKLNIKEIEAKWRDYWEREKIYKFNFKSKKKIYSIDTPPPTVSGKMHVGHAFSFAQQDFIARFWRMKQNVFYPFGTDDNGLPTERLIEKIKNIKSKKMPRGEFIKLCLKTLKEITSDFIDDWKKLGVSADYDLCYSTIDDCSRKISQESFLELYRSGRIYQKKFPTLWCPECQTAIAQAELEDKEMPSLFSTLKFSVDKKDLLIATTRPELLPACICIFVHPNDKRYKNFVGKKAKVPLFDFEVPIIEDKSADVEKGTGALMVCSYGDKYDVDAIQRHKLNPRVVFTSDGKLNSTDYKNMNINDARRKILDDLKKNKLIVEQKKISHTVNVHDKCGTPIEFIETEQWFIKILDLKKKLVEQGKKINWYPKFMFKRYKNWVEGLEWDWSISRDRHFGIPIPVWYCKKCGELIVARENELPVDPTQVKKKCPKCKNFAEPEIKVLDTWATSSLTPQLALGLIKNKLKIPMSLRPQAHDIIRTWAFYTITKSYVHEKKIPWKDVMVSGFVTLGKEKMSKSKGNIVSPQEVLEKFGADAMRYWAAGPKLGENLDYQEQDLVAGKKFVTKIFNASRFIFMNLKDYKKEKPKEMKSLDRLFLSKLAKVVNDVTENFEKYEYSKAKQEIEKFFWKDFCDNYLEIVKKRVYAEESDEKLSAQYTLYKSFLLILKLIAPIMPFITEEVYQNYFKKFEKVKSIHLCDWPEVKVFDLDEWDKCHLIYEKLIDVISKVRQEKSKKKKAMNCEIDLELSEKDYMILTSVLDDLKNVTCAKEIKKAKKFRVGFD